MKSCFIAFGILFSFTCANAARLENMDLKKILIMDQETGDTQGILQVNDASEVTYGGTVAGKKMSCKGNGEFSERNNYFATLTCNGDKKSLLNVNLYDLNMIVFLQGGFVTAKITFAQKKSALSAVKTLISKDMDIKKMN